MATVSETWTWLLTKDELEDYLGLASGEIDGYELLYEAALAACDAFLNNPFVDDDGVDVTIPETIKLGLFEWVRLAKFKPFGDTSSMEKVGDLQKTWPVTMLLDPFASVRKLWRPWRLEPGL